MSDLPELRSGPVQRRKKSALSVVDDGLLVVGAVVAALLVLKALSLVAGTILFMIKIAAIAGVIYVALRLLKGRRS